MNEDYLLCAETVSLCLYSINYSQLIQKLIYIHVLHTTFRFNCYFLYILYTIDYITVTIHIQFCYSITTLYNSMMLLLDSQPTVTGVI